jgi:hypothetical protein
MNLVKEHHCGYDKSSSELTETMIVRLTNPARGYKVTVNILQCDALSTTSQTVIGDSQQHSIHFISGMYCCERDGKSKTESGDLECDEVDAGDGPRAVKHPSRDRCKHDTQVAQARYQSQCSICRDCSLHSEN